MHAGTCNMSAGMPILSTMLVFAGFTCIGIMHFGKRSGHATDNSIYMFSVALTRCL